MDSRLYRQSECLASQQATAPSEGQLFVYQMLGPDGVSLTSMKREQTIRSVTGDQVGYSEVLSMEGMPPSPPEQRQMRLGLFTTATSGRSMRFEDAAGTLGKLRPGMSAEIAMIETVEFDEGRTTASGQISLTFLGCGISETIVAGAPDEPVRVYRLVIPFSSPGSPGKLSEKVELEVLVSQTRGWPVAERSSSGTSVVTSISG